MRLKALAFFLGAGCCAVGSLLAQAPHLSSDEMAAEASALHWQTGTVTLRDGLATIRLQPGYRFLGGEDAEKVLHDLWGNPASEAPLGMIFPPNFGPLDRGGFGVLVEYEEGGHVNDSNAEAIKYDELLKTMQTSMRNANAQRQQQGYPAMELVGWAEPPHYDRATHKLYWAKELREADSTVDGLNYNIRVLGRKGVLVLTAVSTLNELSEVSGKMPEVMGMVDFKAGNTYADFDPRVDKVAKYGIEALVAGGALGVAAKLGLLKFMWPLLLGLKKVIILVVVAAVAAGKKIMAAIRGKSTVVRPFDPPSHGPHAGPPGGPNTPTLAPPPSPHSDPLRPPPSPGTGLPPTKSF